MLSPLTSVLVKIFAKGFYRAHAGLLLFFFVSLITYCFYIYVLNQTHLPPDQVIPNQLIMVLTIISSPVMVVLMFITWLVFTIKSWNYISGQLLIPGNQFLFYSTTSIDKVKQFKSWFMVQLIISIPMTVYGLFSVVIGLVFDYYLIPIIILLYVVLLALISAAVYIRYANNPISVNNKSILSRIVRGWSKPFFSLFLYHVFDKLKVTLVITKALSLGIIAGGFYLLPDISDDVRVAAIITLGITAAHTILVYQSYSFENSRLSFSRNFPYSKSKLYASWALTYLLLTLPESIWFLLKFDTGTGLSLLLFNLGTGMLFRNLLYPLTLDMRKFLHWVFYLFNGFFLMILLKLLWVLVPLNLLASVVVFSRNYYKQKPFLKP